MSNANKDLKDSGKKVEWKEVTVTEYFNVRSAPSPTAPILLVLTRNSKVEVELSGMPWLKVKDPRLPKPGYVSSTILDNGLVK